MNAFTRLTDDLRIRDLKRLSTPAEVIGDCASTERGPAHGRRGTRQRLHGILHGADDRLAVVIGPCSIHDTRAALEYAQRLTAAARRSTPTRWRSSCACISRSRAPRWAGRA